jgi:hypothetical protein
MFAGNVGFWRSLRPVWRRPLGYQPFIILGVLMSTVAWTVTAFAVTVARFVTVVVGQAAFVGGIALCLLGMGYLGAVMGVAGLVASRIAA